MKPNIKKIGKNRKLISFFFMYSRPIPLYGGSLIAPYHTHILSLTHSLTQSHPPNIHFYRLDERGTGITCAATVPVCGQVQPTAPHWLPLPLGGFIVCDPLSLGQLKIPSPVHNRSPITPSLAHNSSVLHRRSSIFQRLFHPTHPSFRWRSPPSRSYHT